jgi:hypothetical protein
MPRPAVRPLPVQPPGDHRRTAIRQLVDRLRRVDPHLGTISQSTIRDTTLYGSIALTTTRSRSRARGKFGSGARAPESILFAAANQVEVFTPPSPGSHVRRTEPLTSCQSARQGLSTSGIEPERVQIPERRRKFVESGEALEVSVGSQVLEHVEFV